MAAKKEVKGADFTFVFLVVLFLLNTITLGVMAWVPVEINAAAWVFHVMAEVIMCGLLGAFSD